ncbi:hypothetical protein [Motiliproteus sp. SC1-56]|uniref:hypothetical protein n=1 Tax=Motiliproteus sp. SC1-56 TaxID=2799565 RepID=UPI001A8D2039|nr:hypothetical protein [Motiliproteus sp. SC1-56]
MRKLMVAYSAGCLGALANSLAVWLAGDLGITAALGVSIAPTLSPHWLYPRIVWGGLWGLLFLLPFAGSRPLFKGTLLSLIPSAVQLFVVFPLKTQHGIAGLGLGLLTPLLVLIFNWIWGVVTALAIRFGR